jgi:hypothetical protein
MAHGSGSSERACRRAQRRSLSVLVALKGGPHDGKIVSAANLNPVAAYSWVERTDGRAAGDGGLEQAAPLVRSQAPLMLRVGLASSAAAASPL